MIKFACPVCRVLIKVPAEKSGTKGRCPGCGQQIKVPAPTGNTMPGVKINPARQAQVSDLAIVEVVDELVVVEAIDDIEVANVYRKVNARETGITDLAGWCGLCGILCFATLVIFLVAVAFQAARPGTDTALGYYLLGLLVFMFGLSIVTACISLKCLFEQRSWVAVVSLVVSIITLLASSCAGLLIYTAVLSFLRLRLI